MWRLVASTDRRGPIRDAAVTIYEMEGSNEHISILNADDMTAGLLEGLRVHSKFAASISINLIQLESQWISCFGVLLTDSIPY